MIPERAVKIIKHYEGWHRALPDGRAAPYLCPAGKWTIGYGATFLLDGSKVTANTKPITREEGERLLMRQVEIFARGVLVETDAAGVSLNANQLGALTSFTFNLGLGNLRSSTLLRHVKAGRFEAAADEFPKWVYAGNQKLDGLVRRRRDERELFMTPIQAQPPQGSAGSRVSDQIAQTVAAEPPAAPASWFRRFFAGLNKGSA